MAETIAAHLPALAAAAAGAQGAASGGASDQLYGLDDEEYPFAHGALNGVKCCTKCGATKTPQWREGPFGERGGRGKAPAQSGGEEWGWVPAPPRYLTHAQLARGRRPSPPPLLPLHFIPHAGPKTLCNACGVKRTRKLRAEQEGAKRRKLGSASPAPLPHLKLASAASYPLPPKYATRPANYSPGGCTAELDVEL